MLTSEPGVVTALIKSQEPVSEHKIKPVDIPPWLVALSHAEELLAVDGCLKSHFSSEMRHLEWVAHTLDDSMLICIRVLLIRLSGL